MKPVLKSAFATELELASAAAAVGDHARSWSHLERAHILSQAYAWPHVWVHWRMLAFAWRRRALREIIGQLARIVVAAPGSWLGRAPLDRVHRRTRLHTSLRSVAARPHRAVGASKQEG